MNRAELLGGVLYDAEDPLASAEALAEILVRGVRDPRRVRELGFEPAIVEAVRPLVSQDPHEIEVACAMGGAWVLGRRSAAREDSWELVASLRAGEKMPRGLRRTTGETLVLVAMEAERRLRFSAPYVDVEGIGYVAEAIAAATARGVVLEVLEPPRSAGWPEALNELRRVIRVSGDLSQLVLLPAAGDAPWSHLKVMVADDSVAYIGSANITRPALTGQNLELGVLVRGPNVVAVNRVLDTYTDERLGTHAPTNAQIRRRNLPTRLPHQAEKQ